MIRFAATDRFAALLTDPAQEDAPTIAASLHQGAQRNQTRPMVWQDLAIAVKMGTVGADGGLSGVIEGGKILVGGLTAEALTIQQGEFALLPATPQGERRMRYRLLCQADNGQRYLLYGFKRIARRPGRFLPLAIWQDTTTLFVTIYALDGQGAPTTVTATGIIHIHLIDFLKQMLTMRARGSTGPLTSLRALTRFGRFFAAGVAAAYLARGGQAQPRRAPAKGTEI
jgi:hypothetical protein